jgi:hypothetical protein
MYKIKTLLRKVNIQNNFLFKAIKNKGKREIFPLQARFGTQCE